MRKLLTVIALFLGLSSINAQVDFFASNKEPSFRYSLKTSPLSPISANFKLIFEQTIYHNLSMDYEFGYRRQGWNENDNRLEGRYGSIRFKYYFFGVAQKGIYISPGVSYEVFSKKSKNANKWVEKSVFSGFVDLGAQVYIRELLLEYFVGMGHMTDSPTRSRFLDLGTPYGTHLGFANQLLFRLGVRVGFGFNRF